MTRPANSRGSFGLHARHPLSHIGPQRSVYFSLRPSDRETVFTSRIFVPASSAKRVLVAPLDWGLGHATRCIPVIRALQDRGATVFIGGAGPHLSLLSREFPSLEVVPLANYGITYATSPLLLALKFPFMVAQVVRRSQREHAELDAVINEHRIDAVISDQRFGCYSRRVKSVYITHQLCVKMPAAFSILERLVARALRFAANRFDQTWIPDFPGDDNLTGDLTRKYPLPRNHRFVGPLSRFGAGESVTEKTPLDLLVMLSGPEPQRTLLEQRMLAQLRDYQGRAVVLLGRPEAETLAGIRDNIQILPHVPSEKIEQLMRTAHTIVCRGGYTTIMELVSLGRSAVLVPTPGQTEQEYLCKRLAKKGWFASVQQNELEMQKLPDSADLNHGFQCLGNALMIAALTTMVD